MGEAGCPFGWKVEAEVTVGLAGVVGFWAAIPPEICMAYGLVLSVIVLPVLGLKT